LTSTRRKHASQTWKAILAGREVLAQGLIKRVGDGTLTNIWDDRWIPNHFDARPLTPQDGHDVVLVSDLLDPDGRWDGAKIRQSFIPVDAEAILHIPPRPQVTDFWAWEPEKHGFYSVKSAYKMLDRRRIREEVVNTASVSEHDVWKKIWKLKVPPKVCTFWWRVIQEFLPTRQILHKRHIEPVPNCEVCGAQEETIRHVLCECTAARAFWAYAKSLSGVKLLELHPVSWAYDLVDGKIVSGENQTMILSGMYSLWLQRNKWKHGEQTRPTSQAVRWAIDLAYDLWNMSAMVDGAETSSVKGGHTQRWECPPEGWLKCNADGAFYEDQWQGATGAVL